MDYKSHSQCLEQLKKAQEAERDMRDSAREDKAFIESESGQWEQGIWDTRDGKPRYTFDMVDPIIDQITGDIEKRDFDIKVTPMGGQSSKETADTFDGLVRNIESISNAIQVYNGAAKDTAVCGLDGWMVAQKYIDGNSFDQDLVIERIPNYLDRVWLGPHEQPDGSDANYGWILSGLPKDEHETKYPDRGTDSLESDRDVNVWYYRQDLVMVGVFYYLKETDREIVLMSNNKTYEVDEAFDSVVDELKLLGITELSRRTRKLMKVCTRTFDNRGWIDDKPKETVFENWLPIVPCYGNFKVAEDKVLYRGAVRKLKDPQRVLNYSLSREIEEGALAPREKLMMTPEQAAGWEESLGTMNTNADPVQFYNHADGQNPPYKQGGATVNPGLRTISDSMIGLISKGSGMFDASMGANPGLQSGKAIEALQDRGETGNNKYITAREISQTHTGRILVNAIPRVYGAKRQIRLLNEDGSIEMTTVGTLDIPDRQTGTVKQISELSVGTYDVRCVSGPSFKNRQSETVTAITEIGAINPGLLELSGDVLLRNIDSPGMGDLAERERRRLFTAGAIPPDQLTEEEQAEMQQMQQQPPQEDPNMVLARAEEQKGIADRVEAETKQFQVQHDAKIKEKQVEIDFMNAETSRMEAKIKQAEAMANIKGKSASAAKALAEAEAQDIENDATVNRIKEVVQEIAEAQVG